MKMKMFRGMAPVLALSAFSAIFFTGRGSAATYTKADNTDALNLAVSWGGTAPGAADIANWSGTYNTAGSLAALLPGSALTWQGISTGSIAGTAAGPVSIGGTGAAVASSVLSIGSSGINMTGANQNLVINAATLTLDASQTWTVPAGRNLRIGSNVLTSNVDGAGGDTTVVTLTGGGTVDANQGASNGFADYTGKWVVGSGTTLRGVGNGTSAWGSNTSADAILLDGGRLAVGAISGAISAVSWSSPVTLGAATTSTVTGQHSGTGTPDLTLQGIISGDGALAVDKLAGTPFILRFDQSANLYTGGTTIDAGATGSIAVFSHVGTAGGTKTPFGTGDITVTGPSATAAALEFNTTALSAVSNAESTINNTIHLNNATLRTREGLVTFNGDINLTGANVLQGQVDLKHINVNGLIAGTGSLTLRATGAQKITLPFANTYSGGTILGAGSSNVGIVVLGDAASLGTGTVSARGAQIWSDVQDLVLPNSILVGNSSAGGLCFGGENNISLTGSISVDNSSRPFQNSGTGLITLAGINLNAGTSAMASFNSLGTTKGPFLVTGAATGSGKIEVRGGTVTLAGASNYTGTTTVANAGRLNLTGSLTSSIIMTGASASVTGSGSTTGSFTTSGASGGSILLDPAAPGSAISAASVAINVPTKVELLSQQPIGTTVYTVLKYGTTAAGLANLSSSNSRGVFADDTINKKLTFAVTAANRTWNATATSTWNTTDLNWLEGDNRFFNGDAVIFGNTGAGAVAVGGTVSPLSVTFNNTAGNDYTLTSTAGNLISGPSGLAKSGTGTVTLVGANTFTGKTSITGGTLAIRADNVLGAVPAAIVEDQLSINGGTLKLDPAPAANITLAANRGITLGSSGGILDSTSVTSSFTATVAGDIAGAGPLTIHSNGDTSDTGSGFAGATILTGFNTFVGPVTIKSGVVAMDSFFGDGSNPVVLDGGGLVDQNDNVFFSHDVEVGAGGGILRSYGSANTTFSAAIRNAAGVPSTVLKHTDGGTQNFVGDGSAFAGTYINARGNANFDSENWSGMNLVNLDGAVIRWGSGTVSRVKSITTDNDLHIEPGTTLDIVSGGFTVQAGVASTNFTVQNDGTLTSSSGTLNFNFQTPYTSAGADNQSVSVLIADYDGATPLTVVKNGAGAINNFNKANTYTGGTTINGGRIHVANIDAFGTGPVTVNSGGQAYLTLAAGAYSSDMTLEGIGPAETAGNLGALRFENNSTTGTLTIAPAGARVVAYGGATGTISGILAGSGNLEVNSSTANHNGTISLVADATGYTGTMTVAQGRLNLNNIIGGSINVSDGATLGGEDLVSGTLTLGSSTGANLRVLGANTISLEADNLVLNGLNSVYLDSLPVPLGPITVVKYNTKTGGIANFQMAPGSTHRTQFIDTGTSIDLAFVTESRTWSGTVDGNWNSTTTNWVEGDQKFYTGDSVLFNDSATTKAVIIPAAVNPASVLFNNSTGNNYTVAGRMVISNGGTLTKQGTGTVTMTGAASNVTGPVQIDGGSLILGTADYQRAVGTSTGIVVNAGTLRLNGINVLYDGGGSTNVTVNAGGTVELNAYHNHFKTLNLNGGTIIGMRSDIDTRYNNEYTTFDTSVTVGGTQMSTIGTVSGGTGVFALAGAPFDVADVVSGTDLLVSGALTGTVLTKNGAGTMTLTANNINTGNTVINSGILDVAANGLYRTPAGAAAYTNTAVVTVATGGTLRLRSFAYNGDGGTGGLADYAARRVLNGGTIEVTGTTHSSVNDFTVGAASGTFRYAPALATDTLTLSGTANSNIDLGGILFFDTLGNITVAEVMGGAGSVHKTGAATLTLNAVNTYTGITTVSAGTLKGTGSVAGGLTVSAGATVAPGNSVGTFTVTGATTLNGAYACEINGAAADRLTVNGNLTVAASGASIAFSTLGAPSSATYVIASYTGTFTGNLANLTVTGLPSGYTLTHDTGAKQLVLSGTASGYGSWASTNGIGSEPASADHDGDGMDNGAEWVLGGNPNVSDTAKLPTLTASGANLVFTFLRDQASKTADTAVAIEVGTSLAGWPVIYTVGNDTATSSAGVTVTDNANGTDTVTLTVPKAPDASKFARLRVTVN